MLTGNAAQGNATYMSALSALIWRRVGFSGLDMSTITTVFCGQLQAAQHGSSSCMGRQGIGKGEDAYLGARLALLPDSDEPLRLSCHCPEIDVVSSHPHSTQLQGRNVAQMITRA